MELDQILGLILLGWLVSAMVLISLLVRRGRKLTAFIKSRHPETYEELGRPRPGLWNSARRTRFARFIAQREFEELGDDRLSQACEAYRKAEIRVLLGIVISLAVVGSLVLTLRMVTGLAAPSSSSV